MKWATLKSPFMFELRKGERERIVLRIFVCGESLIFGGNNDRLIVLGTCLLVSVL